jgi:FAD/FMN-containing dehydrogenase
MAATNAAGAHTLRHGSMRRWVTALDCVFDDGTRTLVRRGVSPPADVPAIARLLGEGAWLYDGSLAPPSALRHARVRKDSSGYGVADYAESGELVDLLVGSEGTLALFVGVEVALAPRPAATSSVLAAFATLDAAVDGAVRARDAGAVACELLDRTFLDVAAASEHPPSLPRGTEAVLLAEVEATSPDEAASLASTLGDAFTAAGASHVALALEPKAEHALWELRHAASPTLARLDPALKSMQFIEDACVPAERLAEYVRGVRAALATQGVRGVIFGHAGDAHMHVNPLVDVRRPEWRAQVESLFAEVSALVVRLGGTLSGEHGDGRLRAPLVRESWGHDAANVFGLVKEAFDPSGILNPGVKLPVAGQRPIEQVKYDPALPPLAPAARRALDLVADRRAYAEFRLDLLDDEQRAQRDQLRQP